MIRNTTLSVNVNGLATNSQYSLRPLCSLLKQIENCICRARACARASFDRHQTGHTGSLFSKGRGKISVLSTDHL